jgi:hypothetical protein
MDPDITPILNAIGAAAYWVGVEATWFFWNTLQTITAYYDIVCIGDEAFP